MTTNHYSRLEVPRTAQWWARKWKVHRNQARKILKRLHIKYGSTVVWRVGQQQAFVASESSLAIIGESRRNPMHPQGGPRKTAHGALVEDYVTQEQLTRALEAIWQSVRELQAAARIAPKHGTAPFFSPK